MSTAVLRISSSDKNDSTSNDDNNANKLNEGNPEDNRYHYSNKKVISSGSFTHHTKSYTEEVSASGLQIVHLNCSIPAFTNAQPQFIKPQ